MEKILSLKDLEALKNTSEQYVRLGENYVYCRISSSTALNRLLSSPVGISGVGLVLISKGEVEGEINFKPFKIEPYSLLSLARGILVNTHVPDPHIETEVECLFISSQFLHDLNIDLNVINLRKMVEEPPSPVLSNLRQDEAETIRLYMRLLYRNAVNNTEMSFVKSIARSLIQALFYQLMQVRYDHSDRRALTKDAMPMTRQKTYVQEFMSLLQLHHKTQRALSFYAEKMFISSKYLSHVVKEATGKSATEWIADFVVMEAKNMLRFSHKNVQQVAYDLNFKTQSSFGKYFKHFTGMSPSEFQKT